MIYVEDAMTLLREPKIEYPADGKVCPAQRFVWHAEPAGPAPEPNRSEIQSRHIVLAGGSDATAARIGAALEALGARISRCFGVDASLARIDGKSVDGIIDLNLDEPFDSAGKDVWERPLRLSVALLKKVYEHWAGVTDASRIFYMPVTLRGGQMGYGAGSYQPLGGIWAGLAKTLIRELPNCNVKILDLSPEDLPQAGSIVAREVYNWGLFEIGYSKGVRLYLKSEREDVGAPNLELCGEDTVLISGGGRGIGLALARSLARNFGCRVVVTGRSAVPSKEDWLELDEAAFKAYRTGQLREAPPGGIAGVRKRLESIARQRELHRHLRQNRDEELAIEYRACDFTAVEQVRALIDSIGPSLTGVIHNAGIDAPVRLNRKPIDSFLTTVRVKIAGFMNILEALEARPLKFLCNVGSLTGRMGGMVGQTDYAAANDGLAQLGLWASNATSHPVKTLCWPTWEKLGMIANYEATLKYMSALNTEEGLYFWQRELLAGGSGEVTFIGQFGKALSPVQMNGIPMMLDIPQSGQLFSRWFYLGRALEFSPHRSLRSSNRIELRLAPCIFDVLVDGRPSMPVSLLLEFAISVGNWVVPEGYPDMELEEIQDIRVNLAGLVASGDSYELEKQGSGRFVNGKWVVDVKVFRSPSEPFLPLAELTLVYGKGTPASPVEPLDPTGMLAPADLPGDGAMRWVGAVFRRAAWSVDSRQMLGASVKPCAPSDLWSMPLTPLGILPATALENVVRLAVSAIGPDDGLGTLCISKVIRYISAGECVSIYGPVSCREWFLVDGRRRTGFLVQGVSVTALRETGSEQAIAASL